MVQFLSINFFSWISSIFVGFFKSSHFLCQPVFFLLVDSLAFYLFARPMKMEQSVPKRWHIKFRRRGFNQKQNTTRLQLPNSFFRSEADLKDCYNMCREAGNTSSLCSSTPLQNIIIPCKMQIFLCVFFRASQHMRREEKPTRCH